MKKLNNFVRLASVIALLFASSAHAQFYVGATGGTSKSKLNADGLNVQFLDLGFTASRTQTDDNDSSARVFGGYQINRYLAVEAGYADLGELSFGAVVQPMGSLTKRIKTSGYDLSALVMYPVTDRFNVFARAGAARLERKSSFLTTGSVELLSAIIANDKTTQNKTTFGAGVTFGITKNIWMRAEYAQYRRFQDELLEGNQKIENYMLGVQYRF